MKPLIKTMFLMASFFTLTLIIAKFFGVLGIEQIKGWIEFLKDSNPAAIGALIVVLLFADLFIAVPTLGLCILSGYFMGFEHGFIASSIGISLAGISGYFLSLKFGESLLDAIIKSEEDKIDLKETFSKYGFTMILLSRALPMLPEVSACLSGMTKMSFKKFILAWLMSSLPYIAVASYFGSISTIDNPKPAIFAAIGLFLFLWTSWFLFSRFKKTNCKKYLHRLNR